MNVIINIIITFMSIIVLNWTITEFWLAQLEMFATLSIIYRNIISATDLRFIISL